MRTRLLALSLGFLLVETSPTNTSGADWAQQPSSDWPHIALVNEIEYVDTHHPIGGCGFLLDTGRDTLAVTAKHVLTYFKSESMEGVSFGNSLKEWRMYPKDNPKEFVIVEALVNEDPRETIGRVPTPKDWLLFTIREKSPRLQPLQLRTTPLVKGEPVFIVGWRYSDKNCTQRIYAGHYESHDETGVLISTEDLSDNRIPGLSGAPVIDTQGRVLGLMSRKAGKLELLSSVAYPQRLLEERAK